MTRLVTLVFCLISWGVLPALAHHSVSGYARNDGVYRTGTVKEFLWSNPHVMLTLEVTEAGGAPQAWTFESLSVGQLAAANFRKTMVAAGDTVTVSFFPRRDGKPGGFFYALTLPDGKTYIVKRPQGLGGSSLAY
jgi:Family of unknown function (DUF6152)